MREMKINDGAQQPKNQQPNIETHEQAQPRVITTSIHKQAQPRTVSAMMRELQQWRVSFGGSGEEVDESVRVCEENDGSRKKEKK